METMQKRKKIIFGIAGLAACIALYFVIQHLLYVTTDDAQIDAHTVMLAPKVGGYISAVNVVEGQHVKQGDVLLEIDERDYQNSLIQVKADLGSLEARKNDAEKNFRRIADLYNKNVVSRQQFDSAQSSYAEVKAKYDAVNANVAQANLNFENTKLRAPSDGYIAKKSVEKGQLASPGVPLIGFVDAGERWVTANFKETEIDALAVGKTADISVDAISGKDFKGKVVAISAATGATFTLLPPDNATGNFTKVVQRVPVKIQIEGLSGNDVELLRAGLSAYVKVHKH